MKSFVAQPLENPKPEEVLTVIPGVTHKPIKGESVTDLAARMAKELNESNQLPTGVKAVASGTAVTFMKDGQSVDVT